MHYIIVLLTYHVNVTLHATLLHQSMLVCVAAPLVVCVAQTASVDWGCMGISCRVRPE